METRAAFLDVFSGELPGRAAHLLMAPPNRFDGPNSEPPLNVRNCSVMLMVYQKDGNYYLPLIKRPAYNGVHGGQMSLPGGKWESFDTSAWDAALRETYEEIGVKGKIEKVAELSSLYIPHSNFLVYPFVGFFDEVPEFVPDNYEVDQLFEIPISSFLLPANKGVFIHQAGDVPVEVPCYYIDGCCIWGATAMIISEFICLLNKC